MTKPQKNKKEFEQGLNIAMRYLSYQPRTTQETITQLEKKKIADHLIPLIIQNLKEHNFLNDQDFARLFIESKIRYKPRSKFAFRYLLKKKGIHSHIIDNILEKYDDEDLAKKAIQIKFNSWQNFDTPTFKKKVINHLRYRGFSFSLCLSALDQFLQKNQDENITTNP